MGMTGYCNECGMYVSSTGHVCEPRNRPYFTVETPVYSGLHAQLDRIEKILSDLAVRILQLEIDVSDIKGDCNERR